MPHSIRLRPLAPRGRRTARELQEAQQWQRARRRQGEVRGGSGEGAREARAVMRGGGVVWWCSTVGVWAWSRGALSVDEKASVRVTSAVQSPGTISRLP